MKWNGKLGNDLVAEGQAKPKPPSAYKIVGQSPPRFDVPAKVFGKLDYVTDIKVPGMLHGRMIRPPVAGAVPVAVDEGSVRDIPGVRVVRDKGFLGIVAEREWDAVQAAERLKVTWSEAAPPFPENSALYQHIRQAPVVKREVPVAVGEIDPVFCRVPRGSSRRNTSGRSSRMPAWVRPARWSTRAPTVPPCGPARKSRILRATGSPARSACRRTRCTGSGSRARAPTGATTPATPGSTRPYCRRRWAARCASRACATRGMAGTPRARPRSIAPAPPSTRTVR